MTETSKPIFQLHTGPIINPNNNDDGTNATGHCWEANKIIFVFVGDM